MRVPVSSAAASSPRRKICLERMCAAISGKDDADYLGSADEWRGAESESLTVQSFVSDICDGGAIGVPATYRRWPEVQ